MILPAVRERLDAVLRQPAVEGRRDFGAKRRNVGICRAELADGTDPHATKRTKIVIVADES